MFKSQRMKHQDLKSMTTDQLWELHESVTTLLGGKIKAEKALLEERLQKLGSMVANEAKLERRPYPKVLPKYHNPKGDETWAGRGKQPRWLTAQLKNGKVLNDFLIRKISA
jgi:DNA-binding protein H-NS